MKVLIFLISSSFALASSAAHQRPDIGACLVVSYALAYFVPDMLDEYRGIVYRKRVPTIIFLIGLFFIEKIGRTYFESIHQHDIARLTEDFLVGITSFTVAIVFDRTPPRKRSKNSKVSDAVKKIVGKVTAVYGNPSPVPVRMSLTPYKR